MRLDERGQPRGPRPSNLFATRLDTPSGDLSGGQSNRLHLCPANLSDRISAKAHSRKLRMSRGHREGELLNGSRDQMASPTTRLIGPSKGMVCRYSHPVPLNHPFASSSLKTSPPTLVRNSPATRAAKSGSVCCGLVQKSTSSTRAPAKM